MWNSEVFVSSETKQKQHRAYFHGELADSTGSIRLFGFHTGIHNQLQKHLKLKTPVTLQGCNINMNTTSDNLEIKVLNKTKVQESKRSITVQDVADEVVQIARSKVLPDYEHIQLQAKILTMLDHIKISANLIKKNAKCDSNCFVQGPLIAWQKHRYQKTLYYINFD